MTVLWPACLDNTTNLDDAKVVFAAHVLHDPAWAEFTPDDLHRFIDQLDGSRR